MTPQNPFISQTHKPLVALKGERNGYIQLAPSQTIESFSGLPPELYMAAQAWAGILEAQGAPCVYWITLAEQVKHKHIHLYPRWPDDTDMGIALFEQRHSPSQPVWTILLEAELDRFAHQYSIHLL